MQCNLGPARLAALVAAFSLFLAIAPGAAANHVQCGDVITTSVKLDSDIVCTDVDDKNEAGLTIGASNITFDARGYRIRNTFGSDEGLAMTTNGAYSGVVIKNIGGTGGFAFDLSRLQLSDSKVKNNNLDALYGALNVKGDRNIINHNSIDTAYEGISMTGADNRAVQNDIVAFEGAGILASGNGIRIANNNLRALGAIFGGIRVFGFTNAVVTGNDVSEFVFGIRLENGAGASVTRNFVHDNYYGGGIVISSDVSNVDLRRNIAIANGGTDGNGISVDAPSATITRNTANDNGNYGIAAVPGVTDGGGNRASGNGNPAQCVGVRCK